MKSSSLSNAPLVRLLIVLSLLSAVAVPVSQGQVTFAMPLTFAGLTPGFVADFNSDGKPDILSWDGTMNLGNGDGTFHTGVHLNTTALVVAVADFSGDGKPDVYVGNAIFFGNGDGTFQAPVTVTGIFANWAVDLNGDGKADLLGFSQDGSQLLAYVGNGDGTFVSEVPYNLGGTYFTPSLVFGDFNGDHKTDVAVLCGACLQPQGVVLLGNGDGTFQSPPLPGSTCIRIVDSSGRLQWRREAGPCNFRRTDCFPAIG